MFYQFFITVNMHYSSKKENNEVDSDFWAALCNFIFTWFYLSISLSIRQLDAIFVLTAVQKRTSRDKKRYHGRKYDIAGHIVFMLPCYYPDKGTSMW